MIGRDHECVSSLLSLPSLRTLHQLPEGPQQSLGAEGIQISTSYVGGALCRKVTEVNIWSKIEPGGSEGVSGGRCVCVWGGGMWR